MDINNHQNNDPFAQLSNVVLGDGEQERENDPNWTPITPAPNEPVKPNNASMMWVYRDKDGNPVTARVRFDKSDKKDVLPFTYGRRIWEDKNGIQQDTTGWHYKAPKGKVILYQLDKITSRANDPILLVEGEKTADAASNIYPDYVVTTTQGGSNAAQRTDWTALKGRDVVLWGDNDKAGKHYIQEVINALGGVFCASIGVVLTNDIRIPDKWDLADPLPASLMVADAEKRAFYDEWIQKRREILTATTKFPTDIFNRGHKLFQSYETKDGEPKEKMLSDLLFVKGRVADKWDNGHGLIIGFKSHSGQFKDIVLPLAFLADSKLFKRYLLDTGFVVNDADGLAKCLNEIKVDRLYKTIDQTGWNENKDHEWAFVLPTKERWGCKDFYSREYTDNHLFARKGFVSDWRREIGQHIGLNSRLCFACCVGLAGLLLNPLGKQGSGFHFVGSSSIGKTTIANVVASLYGKPKDQIKNLVQQWKPEGADTQIIRVAEKFALAAIAGEEATEQGLTGWEVAQATHACRACFEAWLDYRGGAENEEIIQAIDSVKEFVAKYAESRFSLLIGTNGLEEDPTSKTSNRVGHRKQDQNTKEWEYWVYPQCWKELCGGLDGAFVARVLSEKGFLDRGSEHKSFQKRVSIGKSQKRMYVLTNKITE